MNANRTGVAGVTRREFVTSTAGLAAGAAVMGAVAPSVVARMANVAGSDEIKVALIGCGGRGTGAAVDSLASSPRIRIWAMADAFADRVESCHGYLSGSDDLSEDFRKRVDVPAERRFIGFDGFKPAIDSGVQMVILAQPPHFRPAHFAAAVNAGKHVFMEKPVGVDPVQIRQVIEAAAVADQKKLGVVTGTQRRHEQCYLEAMKRVQDGAIGRIVGARVYWNQGGLWSHDRKPGWSDLEYQMRNWLYYTWLSGDHIVEQHIHNLDVMNWAMGGPPAKVWGTGGRQVRTEVPRYGHIFDHFGLEYEYPNGVVGHSWCRQIDGTKGDVKEVIIGTDGELRTTSGYAEIVGKNPWKFTGKQANPYRQEHVDLIQSIEAGKPLNEAKRTAESTLTAIMGRMAAYTGQEVTWEFVTKQSQLKLGPAKYELGAAIPVDEVAMPGRTKLV
ncbi:MAG: Gfo/Idh/MocA family oxidoreductase [Phycisphaerales bacterium]|nr:Gfo/Idh/MocA family oxidoreductase [Phycisphaerales bacterium]